MRNIFIRIKTQVLLVLFLGTMTACNMAANNNTQGQKNNTNITKENRSAKTPLENKQERLVEIFDGRKDLDYRDFSKEETNLVQAEFDRKKAEIEEKFGDRYCGENEIKNVGLNGIVKGSFTKPNSNL